MTAEILVLLPMDKDMEIYFLIFKLSVFHVIKGFSGSVLLQFNVSMEGGPAISLPVKVNICSFERLYIITQFYLANHSKNGAEQRFYYVIYNILEVIY